MPHFFLTGHALTRHRWLPVLLMGFLVFGPRLTAWLHAVPNVAANAWTRRDCPGAVLVESDGESSRRYARWPAGAGQTLAARSARRMPRASISPCDHVFTGSVLKCWLR